MDRNNAINILLGNTNLKVYFVIDIMMSNEDEEKNVLIFQIRRFFKVFKIWKKIFS